MSFGVKIVHIFLWDILYLKAAFWLSDILSSQMICTYLGSIFLKDTLSKIFDLYLQPTRWMHVSLLYPEEWNNLLEWATDGLININSGWKYLLPILLYISYSICVWNIYAEAGKVYIIKYLLSSFINPVYSTKHFNSK